MKTETAERVRKQIQTELIRDHHPDGFPTLPEIPGARYTSSTFYDLEMAELWKKSWLCVFRADELPEPGCYKLVKRLGHSVVITRGRDHTIRAFHNACRHRGAPVVTEDGKRNLLMCKYHMWSYNLNGELIRVPEEHDFGDFDRCSHSLLSVRCEEWQGWVFINFDSGAETLAKSLESVTGDLTSLGMNDLTFKGRLHYKIQCNWKAALDAFSEAYHVPAIHPQTVDTLLDGKGTAIALFKGGHSRMAMPKRFNTGGGTWAEGADQYDVAGAHDIFRTESLAYGFFPNFVCPFDPSGFPFIIFWPDGKSRCDCEVIFVGGGDPSENCINSAYWKELLEGYDAIMQEDIQFLSGIQESLESGAFPGMTLCHQERRIYWMHEEIDRRIGREKVPAELRVEPVLSQFVER